MKSMTGYGSAQAEDEGDVLRVEVSSSNHRFLKVTMRLPEPFGPYEREIEKMIREVVTRGGVSVVATYQPARPLADHVIDTGVIERYRGQLDRLGRQLGIAQDVSLGVLLSLPGVVVVREDPATTVKKWKAFRLAFRAAIDKMAAMRDTEGVALKKELENRARKLAVGVERVEKQAPRIVSSYAERLGRRLRTLLNGTEARLNEQDVIKEVALFAERSDITEETCRLKSHLDQLIAEIAKDGELGRKLDFIAQEMLREVNTIGSKANDAGVSKIVVNMKAEIDKIKEQVQNIE